MDGLLVYFFSCWEDKPHHSTSSPASQDVNYETFLNELTILEGIVNNFMIYHMTVNQLFIWNDPYVSRE